MNGGNLGDTAEECLSKASDNSFPGTEQDKKKKKLHLPRHIVVKLVYNQDKNSVFLNKSSRKQRQPMADILTVILEARKKKIVIQSPERK